MNNREFYNVHILAIYQLLRKERREKEEDKCH
jgi:hypothetical protein